MKTVIWNIHNPFDLYDKDGRVKAENAIREGIENGSITLINLDDNPILEKHRAVGASDTATRDRIYMMLNGISYEDAFERDVKSSDVLMRELDDLIQDAIHLKFKIKRSYYQDYFFDAERYEDELEEVKRKIKILEEKIESLNNK